MGEERHQYFVFSHFQSVSCPRLIQDIKPYFIDWCTKPRGLYFPLLLSPYLLADNNQFFFSLLIGNCVAIMIDMNRILAYITDDTSQCIQAVYLAFISFYL